jgi:hypothetical protein
VVRCVQILALAVDPITENLFFITKEEEEEEEEERTGFKIDNKASVSQVTIIGIVIGIVISRYLNISVYRYLGISVSPYLGISVSV